MARTAPSPIVARAVPPRDTDVSARLNAVFDWDCDEVVSLAMARTLSEFSNENDWRRLIVPLTVAVALVRPLTLAVPFATAPVLIVRTAPAPTAWLEFDDAKENEPPEKLFWLKEVVLASTADTAMPPAVPFRVTVAPAMPRTDAPTN